ncbi:MAG: hypothetical protein Kow0029_21180 [Candidatus Rifleibacteriota bacterium]
MSLLILEGCCNRAKKNPGNDKVHTGAETAQSAGIRGESMQKAPPERPLDILAETGLNYSINSRNNQKKGHKMQGSAFFESQYLEGIDLMEKGEFSKAISVFEAIVQRYPNSEEASIAELCIAEMYFRNKSNDLALKAYEKIVEKYPNSHAAENARAGIRYLKDFEKYEKEYIPADIEDRKRRGY